MRPICSRKASTGAARSCSKSKTEWVMEEEMNSCFSQQFSWTHSSYSCQLCRLCTTSSLAPCTNSTLLFSPAIFSRFWKLSFTRPPRKAPAKSDTTARILVNPARSTRAWTCRCWARYAAGPEPKDRPRSTICSGVTPHWPTKQSQTWRESWQIWASRSPGRLGQREQPGYSMVRTARLRYPRRKLVRGRQWKMSSPLAWKQISRLLLLKASQEWLMGFGRQTQGIRRSTTSWGRGTRSTRGGAWQMETRLRTLNSSLSISWVSFCSSEVVSEKGWNSSFGAWVVTFRVSRILLGEAHLQMGFLGGGGGRQTGRWSRE